MGDWFDSVKNGDQEDWFSAQARQKDEAPGPAMAEPGAPSDTLQSPTDGGIMQSFIDTAKAIPAGLSQGLSRGWGEEGMARVNQGLGMASNSLFGTDYGTDYNQLKLEGRTANTEAQRAAPWTYEFARAAGSLPGDILATLADATGAGGVVGAIDAGGYSNADLGSPQYLKDVAAGTATGLAMPGIIGAAGKGLSKLGGYVKGAGEFFQNKAYGTDPARFKQLAQEGGLDNVTQPLAAADELLAGQPTFPLRSTAGYAREFNRLDEEAAARAGRAVDQSTAMGSYLPVDRGLRSMANDARGATTNQDIQAGVLEDLANRLPMSREPPKMYVRAQDVPPPAPFPRPSPTLPGAVEHPQLTADAGEIPAGYPRDVYDAAVVERPDAATPRELWDLKQAYERKGYEQNKNASPSDAQNATAHRQAAQLPREQLYELMADNPQFAQDMRTQALAKPLYYQARDASATNLGHRMLDTGLGLGTGYLAHMMGGGPAATVGAAIGGGLARTYGPDLAGKMMRPAGAGMAALGNRVSGAADTLSRMGTGPITAGSVAQNQMGDNRSNGYQMEGTIQQLLQTNPEMFGKYLPEFQEAEQSQTLGALIDRLEASDSLFRTQVSPRLRGMQ